MPADFVCKRCDLRFSVGWYHYHGFASGYGSSTLLVCTECGTQHSVEWAVSDRGPPFFTWHRLIVESVPARAVLPLCRHLRSRCRVTLAEALEIARNPPFGLIDQTSEDEAASMRDELAALGISSRTVISGRLPNADFGPIQHHRLLYRTDPMFGKTTTPKEWVVWNGTLAQCEEPAALKRTLTCQHCYAHGKLASDIEATCACPSCKEQELVADASWIT